jgi:hypothetical protein
LKTLEVLTVARYDWQILSKSGCRDQQISEPSPRRPALFYDRGIHATVGTRGFDVEGQRVEGCLGSLQSILSASTLGHICRR